MRASTLIAWTEIINSEVEYYRDFFRSLKGEIVQFWAKPGDAAFEKFMNVSGFLRQTFRQRIFYCILENLWDNVLGKTRLYCCNFCVLIVV